MRFGRLALVFAALSAVAACTGGSNTTATAPDAPTSGTLSFVYQRPAGMTCRSAGTQYSSICSMGPSISSVDLSVTAHVKWGSYAFGGVAMADGGNGRFTFSHDAPTAISPDKLGVFVSDPWLCAPVQICNYDSAGTGLSINGTNMKDHATSDTSNQPFWFSYDPATGTVTPQ